MIGRKAEGALAQEDPADDHARRDERAGKVVRRRRRNRVILVDGPEADKGKAALPSKDRVLAIIDAVAKRTIEPWRTARSPPS